MRRVLAFVVLVAAAVAHPLPSQAPGARAERESAQVAAESGQSSAARERDSLEAAIGRAKAEAESVRGVPAPTATPGELLPFVVSVIAILAFLVLLWAMLGRPGARRWLAQCHGAQVLLLWGVMVLYTFASCAWAVADAFSRTGAHEY